LSKIALSGDPSGTGTFTIASPNSNSNYTLTLPANSGTLVTTSSTGQVIPRAALPAGSVLQVVQAYTATGTTTTSGSPVDTTLSATITPTSASSKVLVLMNSNGYTARGGTVVAFGDAYFYIVRGSTQLVISRTGINFGNNTWTDMFPAQNSLVYLDSPATTNATTYKMQISTSNSLSLSVPFQSFATMTLLEVAA
jgi:hypothetical protein